MTKRVALYLRVSTAGGSQTTRNQLRDLKMAAKRHGWQIIKTFEDDGISGAKGREQRPGLDALLKAVSRREVDLVAAWSVDRLGRSLQDLVGTLAEIHGAKADLFLFQQGLDTTTPAGRAMFGMLSVFAEFERALIRARIGAGMARAKAEGKRLGRPGIDSEKRKAIRAARDKGWTMRRIAAHVGVSLGVVQRVTAES